MDPWAIYTAVYYSTTLLTLPRSDMDPWAFLYIGSVSVTWYKTSKKSLALTYVAVYTVSFLGIDPKSRMIDLNY